MLARQDRTLSLSGVSSTTLMVALLASGGGVSFGLLQGWPVWADGAAAVVPWLPSLTADTIWVYRRYRWLGLFYVLVVTQTGHFIGFHWFVLT